MIWILGLTGFATIATLEASTPPTKEFSKMKYRIVVQNPHIAPSARVFQSISLFGSKIYSHKLNNVIK